MRRRKPTIVDELMNEKVRYADLFVMRRGQLLNWLTKERGIAFLDADKIAFHLSPQVPEETPLTPQSIIDAFTEYLNENHP